MPLTPPITVAHGSLGAVHPFEPPPAYSPSPQMEQDALMEKHQQHVATFEQLAKQYPEAARKALAGEVYTFGHLPQKSVDDGTYDHTVDLPVPPRESAELFLAGALLKVQVSNSLVRRHADKNNLNEPHFPVIHLPEIDIEAHQEARAKARTNAVMRQYELMAQAHHELPNGAVKTIVFRTWREQFKHYPMDSMSGMSPETHLYMEESVNNALQKALDMARLGLHSD